MPSCTVSQTGGLERILDLDFWTNLSVAMKALGLTQKDMVDPFDMTQQGISRLIGSDRVPVKGLTAFVQKYKINPAFLFGLAKTTDEIIYVEKSNNVRDISQRDETLDIVKSRPILKTILSKLAELTDTEIGIIMAAADAILNAHPKPKEKSGGE